MPNLLANGVATNLGPSYSSNEIDLSIVDFEYIAGMKQARPANIRHLKRIIVALQDEPYPELLQCAKDKLIELDPSSLQSNSAKFSNFHNSKNGVNDLSNDELTSMLSDLKNWSTNSKQKDQKLRGEHATTTPSSSSPSVSSSSVIVTPIRGTSDHIRMVEQTNLISSSVSKATGKNGSKKPASIVSTANLSSLSKMSSEEKQLLFVSEKEKGNECYKGAEYADSITYYARALEISTSMTGVTPDLSLYTNLSMSHMKLKQWDSAISQCTKCLSYDANFIKAYWRRCMAHSGKLFHDKAIDDCKYAIQLATMSMNANSAASNIKLQQQTLIELNKLLIKCEQLLYEADPSSPLIQHIAQEKRKSSSTASSSSSRTSSSSSSSKPSSRMTIEEVSDEEEDGSTAAAEELLIEHVTKQKAEMKMKEQEDVPNNHSTTTANVSAKKMTRMNIVEDSDDDEEEDAEKELAIESENYKSNNDINEDDIIIEAKESSEEEDDEKQENSSSTTLASSDSSDDSSSSSSSSSAITSACLYNPTVHSIPINSLQFEQTYTSLRSSSPSFYAYLYANVPPSHLARLYKSTSSSLTMELFAFIMTTLVQTCIEQTTKAEAEAASSSSSGPVSHLPTITCCVEYWEVLCSLNRFSLHIRMLDDDVLHAMSAILNSLLIVEPNCPVEESRITTLKTKYGNK